MGGVVLIFGIAPTQCSRTLKSAKFTWSYKISATSSGTAKFVTENKEWINEGIFIKKVNSYRISHYIWGLTPKQGTTVHVPAVS